MPYEFACAEHIGDRKEQQDRVMAMSHPLHADVTLALVADGMGGHTGGALAAQSVADAVTPVFAAFDPGTGPAEDWLRGMVTAAHDRVAAAGKGYNRDPRSTCVLALAQRGRIDWAHCGDSRLYLFRDNQFVSRTEDHSLVEVLLQQGKITEAEVLTHPERSKIFSSLGGPETPQITFGFIDDVKARDTVLLCSDGLWAYFDPREMAELTGYRDVSSACERLIGLARRRAHGSGDNLSIALLRQPGAASRPGLLGSLLGTRAVRPTALEDARRYTVRYLRAAMGPAADDLTGRIESCTTPQEFKARLPRCTAAMERLTGTASAELFRHHALDLLEEI